MLHAPAGNYVNSTESSKANIHLIRCSSLYLLAPIPDWVGNWPTRQEILNIQSGNRAAILFVGPVENRNVGLFVQKAGKKYC